MILIAGDSWSAGEWQGNHTMSVLHNGLAQYLSDDGHLTINLGQPGGWNGLSIDRLKNFLKLNSYLVDKITHIFVFQTEWIRDIEPTRCTMFSISNDNDFDSDYQTLKNRLISRFYYSLSNIGKEYNKKIFVIGGASDTIWLTDFSKEYPHVEILCQSLTNLLINNNHRVETPTLSVFGLSSIQYIHDLKSLYIDKDFDQALKDIDQGSQRYKLFLENKNFFWPDGTHPNRGAHKLLFDYIKNQSIL